MIHRSIYLALSAILVAQTVGYADDPASMRAAAEANRKWLQERVINVTKDKKQASQMRAQLARMNPRELTYAVKRYEKLYDREQKARDRYSTLSPGKQLAARKAREAAMVRRSRIQANRNFAPGFAPVVRTIPGGRQQPANPIRMVPLPYRVTPQLRPMPFGFIIKNGYAGSRSTPGWYKKVRSR